MSTKAAMTGPEATVTLEVDGRRVSALRGSYLLEVIRQLGIEIPALCDHPDLEPVAACRLCMVEVTHPDWNGWSGLMTACIYPVAEGIQVSTRSDSVLRARRGVLALLAARCPGSDVIQRLARRHGVELPPLGLLSDPAADDCILCGLCTRVCETYATSAIATVSRGATKRIATFADAPPEECVACGACALVCPTGHITQHRSTGAYAIWDRTVEVPVVTVDQDRCLGCGACEEACPFSVARVTLRAGGERVALIPADHCRGCGACVGACPSAALDQPGPHSFASLIRHVAEGTGGALVLACARANLRQQSLPDGVRLLALPCAGRVSLPLLLWALASHADGVLVLGRHQRTCRFDGAEDPARRRVDVVRRVLSVLGHDPERVQFVEPAAGRDGPGRAVRQFAARLTPLPRGAQAPDSLLQGEGLDTAIALVDWMQEQAGGKRQAGAWLESVGLPAAAPGGPALVLQDLARQLALDDELLRPTRLTDQVAAGLAVLAHLGHPGAGVTLEIPADGPAFTLGNSPAGATPLDRLLCDRAEHLPRPRTPIRVACDGTRPGQRELIAALGHKPVDVGPDPLPPRFSLSPDLRRQAEERLQRAEAAGARALLVEDPAVLARWALVTREGTWRSSRVRPLLALELAHHALTGVALTPVVEVAS